MFEKVKELFEMIDELKDWGFYTYEEVKEIKDLTLKNFKRIWGV